MQADVVFPRRPVPAVVVVDSRNVHGQARDVFGQGREVSVGGVVAMLATYGFAADEVWVGIATQGDRKGSPRLTDLLKRNADYAARVVSDPRGHVLEGRLVERTTKHGIETEEKLVDVLCAIQIARLSYDIASKRRSGVIIVLSEDMDLIPAYEFASDLGVTVYACSNERVDTRADYSRWLLLPEGSLIHATGTPRGREVGYRLRRFVADLLTKPTPNPLNFKAGGWDPKRREVFLRHGSGATALWPEPPSSYTHVVNSPHSLYIHGVDFDGGPFPRLVVGAAAPPVWPPEGLQQGTAAGWRTPTRCTMSLDSGITTTLEAPSGSLLTGFRVLVHKGTANGQEAWRFIGALQNHVSVPGWSNPTCPVVVRVISTATSAGARVRGKILATDQEVTLQPPAEERAQAGMEFAALPIDLAGTQASEPHVIAIAISSQLR